MVKSKILNFQQLRNVEIVKEMVQDQALHLIHVHIVVVMGKYDLTKVFLLSNKPVLNVTELEKRSQIHVVTAMVKEKLKPQKK